MDFDLESAASVLVNSSFIKKKNPSEKRENKERYG